ncbi:hypothetical protein BpHYR1_046004 [Brachionus plicatilis]|uniref:Uncharacterized protein n=1 Tax=Brachionus plicatilis TaxID=10195 RepID=A0A3M7PDI1_BRAPC|nr:hypothetical protein BpHYR1_046004 [Brachionus plicatilis]
MSQSIFFDRNKGNFETGYTVTHLIEIFCNYLFSSNKPEAKKRKNTHIYSIKQMDCVELKLLQIKKQIKTEKNIFVDMC